MTAKPTKLFVQLLGQRLFKQRSNPGPALDGLAASSWPKTDSGEPAPRGLAGVADNLRPLSTKPVCGELLIFDTNQQFATHKIAAGELKVLPLKNGGDAFAEIYLVLADPEGAGPGVRRLAEILKKDVRNQCTNSPREGTRTRRARSCQRS